jgi:hypothetical protein
MQCHRPPQAGAAAGEENRAILQHVFLKHDHRPKSGIAAALYFSGNEILVH